MPAKPRGYKTSETLLGIETDVRAARVSLDGVKRYKTSETLLGIETKSRCNCSEPSFLLQNL